MQYRLKQVDLDGVINFYRTITVDHPTAVLESAPIEVCNWNRTIQIRSILQPN